MSYNRLKKKKKQLYLIHYLFVVVFCFFRRSKLCNKYSYISITVDCMSLCNVEEVVNGAKPTNNHHLTLRSITFQLIF